MAYPPLLLQVCYQRLCAFNLYLLKRESRGDKTVAIDSVKRKAIGENLDR